MRVCVCVYIIIHKIVSCVIRPWYSRHLHTDAKTYARIYLQISSAIFFISWLLTANFRFHFDFHCPPYFFFFFVGFFVSFCLFVKEEWTIEPECVRSFAKIQTKMPSFGRIRVTSFENSLSLHNTDLNAIYI